MGAASPLFHHRPFRRYFTGQALSLVGDGLVPLTIAFAALQVAGPGALGLVLAANRVPIAALVLFGGALGDRWNRRTVMVGADVLRAVTQTATGFLLISGQAGMVSLVALQALAVAVGAQGALFLTMQTTTVQQHVPEHERSRVSAWTQLGNLVLLPASLAAAGPVAATIGGRTVLLVGAGWLVVSTVLVLCSRAVRQVGIEKASPTEAGEAGMRVRSAIPSRWAAGRRRGTAPVSSR